MQRTNQLNFSGRKYDRSQLRWIQDDSGLDKYVLSCADKFGAYGLIGFGIVRSTGEEIEIQDLMLSCRIQGKLLEQAFLHHVETHHNPGRARRLRVNFIETDRNQPARQALEAAGLQKLERGGGYAREIPSCNSATEVVRVACSVCCNAETAALKG